MLDALVVGAGPAGSTAALILAREGKRVCVYERSVFPRTKACGEYLSPGTVRMLHALGVGEQLEPQARLVRGVRLHGHGVYAVVDFPAPGWSLPRSVLDDALLNAARRAGALVKRARVHDCADGEDFARVAALLSDGTSQETHARALLGADGMHSIVARKCGFASPRSTGSRFALGGHYRGFTALDGYIDMFVDGRTYVAINPLSDDTANVMLVVNERDLRRHRRDVDAFAEERARGLAGDMLRGAALDGTRVAIGPLSYRARRLAGRRVLLAGDAACFLDPFTGQGVYLALRCGQLAAHCVLSGSMREYEQRACREIAARERASRRVASIVGSPLLARAGAAMMRRFPLVVHPLIAAVGAA